MPVMPSSAHAPPWLRDARERVSWELRSIVGQHPVLCRRLIKSGEQLSEETDIVIEGFPRTGNTFAVIAFQSAQPNTLSIAHHVHAPGPVLDAMRLGKPAIVLIREPEETILSFVIRFRGLTLGQGLRSYSRFYSPLLPHRSRFVTARFDDLVGDFGGVLRRVNEMFGTAFEEFEHTESNIARVQSEVDQWDRNTFGEGRRLEEGRARPSAVRTRMKDELRAAYLSRKLASLRARAEALYERFANG
jgi:hypothetical protein